MSGLEATFREDKHVALLALPLQSEGRLYFFRREASEAGRQPEGYLARIVTAPEPSTVTITPRELRLQNRDGTEVIDLSRSDKVRTFITSLVHVFAGDETALVKTYRVDYTLDEHDVAVWALTLVPRVEPLDKMLKHLRLVGRGETVERIEIAEPNGDRTVTQVLTANPARRFDRAEQKRLFGIDAP
ncbi:MAG: outer membrane lipoprotein carrier protein LolA [Planctomycetes bacterium]|nr:outer membrane lipoprotein carrier protein LolA [Planctomycetota bacterium]